MAPTVNNVLTYDDETPRSEVEWLQLLLGDWQVVSDLLGSDLVLWVPREEGMCATAHSRPANGSTVYFEDPISTRVRIGPSYSRPMTMREQASTMSTHS